MTTALLAPGHGDIDTVERTDFEPGCENRPDGSPCANSARFSVGLSFHVCDIDGKMILLCEPCHETYLLGAPCMLADHQQHCTVFITKEIAL